MYQHHSHDVFCESGNGALECGIRSRWNLLIGSYLTFFELVNGRAEMYFLGCYIFTGIPRNELFSCFILDTTNVQAFVDAFIIGGMSASHRPPFEVD